LLYHFSYTPIPVKAKSYFTGSLGSSVLRLRSSSCRALASFCLRDRSPSLRATLPECTSKGQESCEGCRLFQRPKSTPRRSFRTIQRKNILMRLAAEPLRGSLMCFWVRGGCSI